MRTILAAAGASLAALVLAAAPAQAQRWSDPNFMAAANVTVHRSGPPNFTMGADRHEPAFVGSVGRHRHDRAGRHSRRGSDGFDGAWFGIPDAYAINRSWDSDSYNDWWHDRPDRAYPRWVQHNDGCDEGRMWQGGGAWRCGW